MNAPVSLGEGRRQSRKTRPCWLPTRLGLALVLCASLAQAQASDAQLAIGRDLDVEARALMDASKWEEATTKLYRVLRIKETPGVRFLLGYCHQNRGLLVEAGLEYARARVMIDAGTDAAPDVVEFLNEEQARLVELTPTLVIQVPNPELLWKLSVGTKTYYATELTAPLQLNPGTHRLVVTAPGYAPWELTLHLEQKDRRRFVAPLEPLPPAPPVAARADNGVVTPPVSDTQAAPTDASWRPVVLVSAGGGGAVVAAVAFGIGFAVAQGNASSNAERSADRLDVQLGHVPEIERCNGMFSTDPDVAQSCGALAQGRTDEVFYGNGAIASFVTAGALAVLTAGAIWWTWPGATARHYSIAPAPTGDGAVVSSRWRF